MNFPSQRSHQLDPDTTPDDRRGPTGHRDDGPWSRPSPRDSAAILLSQSVARISDDELQRMDRNDLIDVARCASSVLPRQECLWHLPYMTHDQLQQLACLARRGCRLQMNPGMPLR